MTGGSHKKVNIWTSPLADRPPPSCGPSAVLLHIVGPLNALVMAQLSHLRTVPCSAQNKTLLLLNRTRPTMPPCT